LPLGGNVISARRMSSRGAGGRPRTVQTRSSDRTSAPSVGIDYPTADVRVGRAQAGVMPTASTYRSPTPGATSSRRVLRQPGCSLVALCLGDIGSRPGQIPAVGRRSNCTTTPATTCSRSARRWSPPGLESSSDRGPSQHFLSGAAVCSQMSWTVALLPSSPICRARRRRRAQSSTRSRPSGSWTASRECRRRPHSPQCRYCRLSTEAGAGSTLRGKCRLPGTPYGSRSGRRSPVGVLAGRGGLRPSPIDLDVVDELGGAEAIATEADEDERTRYRDAVQTWRYVRTQDRPTRPRPLPQLGPAKAPVSWATSDKGPCRMPYPPECSLGGGGPETPHIAGIGNTRKDSRPRPSVP
jgi:hypothetical protein